MKSKFKRCMSLTAIDMKENIYDIANELKTLTDEIERAKTDLNKVIGFDEESFVLLSNQLIKNLALFNEYIDNINLLNHSKKGELDETV